MSSRALFDLEFSNLMDIRDEGYSEAMDEIDRLERSNDRLIQEKANLKTLIKRAVEALSYQAAFINDHCCDGYPECGKLIAELREAAE